MQVLAFTNIFNSNKSNFYFGIVACVIIVTGLFLTLVQPGLIDLDTSLCAAVANKNLHQGGLYISTWENKPPALIYLLQLLIFIFSNHVYLFFCLAYFVAIVLALGLYLLYYKYFESIFITILFSFFSFILIFQAQFYGYGLYTELFCAICIVYALVFFEYKTIKNNYNLAALLAGLSFWFKEPSLLPALLILVLLLIVNQSLKLRLKLIIYFAIPSLFFLILLSINGSLLAFIKTIIYNFSYINTSEKVLLIDKIGLINQHLFAPVKFICITFCVIFIWSIINKKITVELLFFIFIAIASGSFFLLSPYSLGHYYLPFAVCFFIVFVKFYSHYKQHIKVVNSIFLCVIMFLTYQSINHYIKPEFTYKIEPYKPDNIAKRLFAEPKKTLFVDYVNKVDYFIKGNKIHPTFVPVALPVHFGDSAQGIVNRKRIWHEMNHTKSDFLITTHTTSYFYWHIPNNGFYEKNYEKIDSLTDKDKFIIYLWQLKK